MNLPLSLVADHMVVTLACQAKSARVKQLILEKVAGLLIEERQEEALAIFKATKDKIVAFVQKDTNANVRDAAVGLLAVFKIILGEDPSVAEAINSLPKYRVAEINKVAGENKRAQG